MSKQEEFQNKHSKFIYNILEDEVVNTAKSLMIKEEGLCNCEKCLYDVSAIALNNISPHYTTTQRGELFARVEQTTITEKTQVMIEVLKAIKIVKGKKAHT
jgi:competence protein ComFB